MDNEAIEQLAAALRLQTHQARRRVHLDPILGEVNAEVRVVYDIPDAGESDEHWYRTLDGFCIRGARRHYIIVNGATSPRSRQRFTIAHEIKHTFDDADCSLFSETPHPSNQPEREANYFAGALLMARDQIIEDFFSGTPEDRMADVYGVSRLALRRRLIGLELVQSEGRDPE